MRIQRLIKGIVWIWVGVFILYWIVIGVGVGIDEDFAFPMSFCGCPLFLLSAFIGSLVLYFRIKATPYKPLDRDG